MAIDIKLLPEASGIYYFFNDKMMYVGKAKNLRRRINQHRMAYNHNKRYVEYLQHTSIEQLEKSDTFELCRIYVTEMQKIDLVFNKIQNIHFDICPESYLTRYESIMIKKHSPQYNYQSYLESNLDFNMKQIFNKCYFIMNKKRKQYCNSF